MYGHPNGSQDEYDALMTDPSPWKFVIREYTGDRTATDPYADLLTPMAAPSVAGCCGRLMINAARHETQFGEICASR